MKLLHIDSSIQGEASVTRQLSAAIVARLKGENPGIEVVRRDLAADPLDHLASVEGREATTPLTRTILDEFLSADVVVIGAPMYNFTVSTQLKTWIDRILVPGATFTYSEAGPEALAGGRRVIVALSRGGLYGAGGPMEAFEHLQSYLGHVFNFIGITPEFIVAEGVNYGPGAREGAISEALAEISALAA